MERRNLLISAGALASAALLTAASAFAQSSWPSREITLIVAVSPGSSADAIARGVAEIASAELGATVVVKNVAGGGGLPGFAELAASRPDGHTFGLVNVGGLLVFPKIQEVPYTWDSFEFLGAVAQNHYGIGVSAQSDIETVADLVEAGKTRRVTYAASAIMNGVALIQLGNETGGTYQYVPTTTQAEAVAQTVGGHVDLVVQTPVDMIPLIESGQLRLLASATTARWPSYPDVPTLQEEGFDAATIVPLGFAAPAGVPEDILERLRAAIARAGEDETLRENMLRLNIVPAPMTSQEFEEALRSQIPVVDAMIEAAGMKQ